jgi:hypothetical protein
VTGDESWCFNFCHEKKGGSIDGRATNSPLTEECQDQKLLFQDKAIIFSMLPALYRFFMKQTLNRHYF